MKKIIFVVLVLIIPLVIAIDEISINRNTYRVDEIVRVSVQETEGYSLSIISPTNVYRFLDLSSNELLFRPQQTGVHIIELYNTKTLDLVDNKSFYVYSELSQDTLFSDKKTYSVGEKVSLYFNPSSEDYSLRIMVDKSHVTYYQANIPFIFTPKKTGDYEVVLIEDNEEKVYYSFSVKKEKRFEIEDSKKKKVDATLKFYKGNSLVASKNINQLAEETFYENESFEVELTPDINNIKKIKFNNLQIKDTFEFGVEDISQQGFVKSYAIDPSKLDFTDAVVTSIAQGDSLYKCADWNFSQQECLGTWNKIQDLTPGEEYSFILTKADPGYGESGEGVPEPHSVIGYIYYSDNITRAENGIPVRIINNVNGESVLTEVYAPPIPQYKGAYSADIYGHDGDSITVRAWNFTHYGEKNSNLLSTTTRVNVTMQDERSSETNVTIIVPGNNTLYNISDVFNVNASIQLLGNNGTACYATVSFSDNIAELFSGEQATLSLGNIEVYDTLFVSWNFSAVSGGLSNITVNASCDTDVVVLENKDSDTITNISVVDQIKPEITLFSPLNNQEMTNPIKIIFNVSDHSGVQNCSVFLNGQINKTMNNPGKFVQQEFNLTLDAGKYYWKIGCYDNTRYNNYNVSETRLFFLPAWHFYYGNLSSNIAISDSANKPQYTWKDQTEANIYVVETGSSIDWLNLQALGRNTSNESSIEDFHEADVNLSMDSFTDSINNTYTENSQPVKTASLLIYNKIIKDIPIFNSTDNKNFFTGILWDKSDGNTEYNGSQDILFVTQKNQTLQGKYGVYDYEIRVPPSLKNYKLGSGSVSFYIELI